MCHPGRVLQYCDVEYSHRLTKTDFNHVQTPFKVLHNWHSLQVQLFARQRSLEPSPEPDTSTALAARPPITDSSDVLPLPEGPILVLLRLLL